MNLYATLLRARLLGNLLPDATTFTVDTATPLPALDVGEYFVIDIVQGAIKERVYATARTGTTFTVTRAREGTSKKRFYANALITVTVDPYGYELVTAQAVASVNSQTGVVVLNADHISDTSTTKKFTTAAEITKLAGIEALADVTLTKLAGTLSTTTIATDDKIILQDTSNSNAVRTVTAQAIRDLAPTSVTTTPTASTNSAWDANGNLSANNFLAGYTSITTAAGTTTLTVASTQTIIFTGSSAQTCVAPVVSTLALGHMFRIVNLSSGVVTFQSSGANTVQAIQANSTLIVISNAVSGTGASVWHVVDYTTAASGQTGSGSLVRGTSPTLVTPALGAATATSINFGQTTLSTYEEGTFTPTFTFATPGNLSVSYAAQTGFYTRVGNSVFIIATVVFTPTFSTASGQCRIGGMPFTSLSRNHAGTMGQKSATITFPASCTQIFAFISGQSYYSLRAYGTSTGHTDLTIANFTTTSVHTAVFSGIYTI